MILIVKYSWSRWIHCSYSASDSCLWDDCFLVRLVIQTRWVLIMGQGSSRTLWLNGRINIKYCLTLLSQFTRLRIPILNDLIEHIVKKYWTFITSMLCKKPVTSLISEVAEWVQCSLATWFARWFAPFPIYYGRAVDLRDIKVTWRAAESWPHIHSC